MPSSSELENSQQRQWVNLILSAESSWPEWCGHLSCLGGDEETMGMMSPSGCLDHRDDETTGSKEVHLSSEDCVLHHLLQINAQAHSLQNSSMGKLHLFIH